MTRDNWVAVLQFLAAVISLAALTLTAIPPTALPYLTFAVGVINLALGIFFGVSKPVEKSFNAGVKSVEG